MLHEELAQSNRFTTPSDAFLYLHPSPAICHCKYHNHMRGRETTLSDGDAILLSNAKLGTVTFPAMVAIC
jgi:hypothetical protein